MCNVCVCVCVCVCRYVQCVCVCRYVQCVCVCVCVCVCRYVYGCVPMCATHDAILKWIETQALDNLAQ